jgi:allantoinase
MTGAPHERDFVGYGPDPPDPAWPGGAAVALNFAMNFEEGSEYSVGDGDGRSESALTEVSATRVPAGERDLAAESMYEYGSRVGFWRIHRIFREADAPLTVFACALALERHPPAAAAIRSADWDVCCHGWRWVEHFRLSEDEERTQIARAVRSLERTIGRPPVGWYCRYGPSVNTRRLLVEHGGFLYDSDAYNDELPYWTRVNGTPHLVVPYSLVTNDSKFLGGGLGTADQYFAFLRDSLDMLCEEGRTQPRMMSVGMHLRLLGHPGRAAGLRRFLHYAQQRGDVWICRREDLARHFASRFPPPDPRS